jgi:hypothetical protein
MLHHSHSNVFNVLYVIYLPIKYIFPVSTLEPSMASFVFSNCTVHCALKYLSFSVHFFIHPRCQTEVKGESFVTRFPSI